MNIYLGKPSFYNVSDVMQKSIVSVVFYFILVFLFLPNQTVALYSSPSLTATHLYAVWGGANRCLVFTFLILGN